MEKIILHQKILSEIADQAKFIFEPQNKDNYFENLADLGLCFLNLCTYGEDKKKWFESENFFNPSNGMFFNSIVSEIERNEKKSIVNSENVKRRYEK